MITPLLAANQNPALVTVKLSRQTIKKITAYSTAIMQFTRNAAVSGPTDLEALASKKPETPQPIPALKPSNNANSVPVST